MRYAWCVVGGSGFLVGTFIFLLFYFEKWRSMKKQFPFLFCPKAGYIYSLYLLSLNIAVEYLYFFLSYFLFLSPSFMKYCNSGNISDWFTSVKLCASAHFPKGIKCSKMLKAIILCLSKQKCENEYLQILYLAKISTREIFTLWSIFLIYSVLWNDQNNFPVGKLKTQ